MKTQSVKSLLLISLALLTGYDDYVVITARSDSDLMQYGNISGLNHAPYCIRTFNVKSHSGNGISGDGLNIQPTHPDNISSGGGEDRHYASLLEEWRSNLRVTVRQITNKKLDGIAWEVWYKTEAKVPEYGNRTLGVWILFLPRGRIKIATRDGKDDGPSSITVKPNDDGPYVVAGVMDAKLTHQDEGRNEKQRRVKATREAELAHRAELRKQEETSQ